MNFKNTNKNKEISLANLIKLKSIFETKEWPYEDAYEDPIFDKFCNLIANLNSEQGELIMTLTNKFLWIREEEYMKFFYPAFERFLTFCKNNSKKNICICPLLPEADFDGAKSSIALIYKIKTRFSKIQNKYSEFNIQYVEHPRKVNLKDIIDNEYTLCLIDDFIGTGETAESAIEYFSKINIKKNQLNIVSIVSMKEGELKLLNNGYNVYSAITCEKGITHNGDKKQIELMQSIEEKIKVQPQVEFGYKKSEALVKMMRTPNNTFPIYWYRNKNNEYAPFPRF